MQTTEHIIAFDSEGLRLHGILYEPPAGPGGRVLVVCDPFAEEKKCAHRPLVDTARALAAAGVSVLRFDYRGCGDSEGDFVDFTPHHWQQDILAALGFVTETLQPTWTGLAGLRMGANLAEIVSRSRPDLTTLILWEPILDGKRYVALNLRRSLVKAMLTEQEAFDAGAVTARHRSDIIEFDGYEVSGRTREELEALDAAGASDPFGGPVLVMQIGPRDEPADDYRALATHFPRGEAVGVRLEPFWNRIGLIDGGAMIGPTRCWLEERPSA